MITKYFIKKCLLLYEIKSNYDTLLLATTVIALGFGIYKYKKTKNCDNKNDLDIEKEEQKEQHNIPEDGSNSEFDYNKQINDIKQKILKGLKDTLKSLEEKLEGHDKHSSISQMVFENLIGLSIKNDKKLFTKDKTTVILRGCNINDINKIITPLDYDISWFWGKYDGYSNESSWHDLMNFEKDLKYFIYSSKFDNGVVVHLQNFKTDSQFEKDLLRENVSDCVKKYYLDFLKFLDDRLLTEAVIMLTYLNFRGNTNSTYYVKGNFI